MRLAFDEIRSGDLAQREAYRVPRANSEGAAESRPSAAASHPLGGGLCDPCAPAATRACEEEDRAATAAVAVVVMIMVLMVVAAARLVRMRVPL